MAFPAKTTPNLRHGASSAEPAGSEPLPAEHVRSAAAALPQPTPAPDRVDNAVDDVRAMQLKRKATLARLTDRRNQFIGALFSALLHLGLLFVTVSPDAPRLIARDAPKVIKIRRYVPRDRPPPRQKKRTVKKRLTKPKPIPDPTPEEPEPIVEPEPEPELDWIPPDVEIVFGEPEGPPVLVPKGPVRIGVDGVQPRVIKRVEPEYPEMALLARVQGVVVLEAVIQKDGTVGDVQILRGLGKSGCNEAAIAALKQWRFEPGRMDDRRVDALMTLTVRFQIE